MFYSRVQELQETGPLAASSVWHPLCMHRTPTRPFYTHLRVSVPDIILVATVFMFNICLALLIAADDMPATIFNGTRKSERVVMDSGCWRMSLAMAKLAAVLFLATLTVATTVAGV